MDQRKKAIVQDVIRGLHAGLAVEEARARIEGEAGVLSSAEIAEIEQSLIDEGMAPEEIQRFCDVHVLLFESSLQKAASASAGGPNPLELLRRENRELLRAVAALRAAGTLAAARDALSSLRAVERHYAIKENAIFPLLERHGFSGPSQVMWAKHDEVRDLLRRAGQALAAAGGEEALAAQRASILVPLAAGVEGMIQKEETVLFPAAVERIGPEEWGTIQASILEIAGEAASVAAPAPSAAATAAAAGAGAVALPSGTVSLAQLAAFLNVLPVDISFVDADDTVRYFNQTKERLFPRAVSVIGPKVQNCHPGRSVARVNEILRSFRDGSRSQADFWIRMGERFVSIRYFAVRDEAGRYLGCLEVSQELTELRALQGERRLLDEGARPPSAG